MPKKQTRGAEAHPHKHNTKSGAALQTMHELVKTILEEVPAARSSDRVLITEVYAVYCVDALPFREVMLGGYDLPSFETITRCRRKVQEENEQLRAVDAIESERIHRQIDLLEYAEGIA